jgi:hypothetical protein
VASDVAGVTVGWFVSAAEKEVANELAPVKRPAYDPNNLHPLDEEARKYDDTSLGIDWDEIIATTEDDFQAGRYAFNSEDYPTHKEAMKALDLWTRKILEDVLRETRAVSSHDAASS